jgi:hypothetical protein
LTTLRVVHGSVNELPATRTKQAASMSPRRRVGESGSTLLEHRFAASDPNFETCGGVDCMVYERRCAGGKPNGKSASARRYVK